MLYTDIAERLLPYLRNTPYPLITDAIHWAMYEFCFRSNAYRHRAPAMAAVAGQSIYTPSIPANTAINKIITAKFRDEPLDATSSILIKDAPVLTKPKKHQLYNGQIVIYGAPTLAEADAFVFELALIPTFSAVEVADAFYQRFHREIHDGALSRLYAMPGKEWSSATDATYRSNLFYAGIADAESRANDEHTAKAPVCAYGG